MSCDAAVMLMTMSDRFRRVRQTNCTDNGFPSRLIQAARPSGNGNSAAQATASAVFDLGTDMAGSAAQNGLVLKPYGAGSNNNTFSLRVIGWRKIDEGDPATSIWDPTVLCELAVTLSSTPIGLAGKVILATDLFADTIAVTYGNANVSVEAVSPANDIAAHAVVDLKGFQLVEVTFTTGGSATNCNALIALL